MYRNFFSSAWSRLRPLVLLLCALCLSATPARARFGPILHEPLGEDGEEDSALVFGAPWVESPAVGVPAPLAGSSKARDGGDAVRSSLQGLPWHGNAQDQPFRPDRNTQRPDVAPYVEPFQPSVAPFKRVSVYDHVDEQYTLSVTDTRLVQVPREGATVEPGSEDRFLADFELDLQADKPLRIPTPGPGARIVQSRLLKSGASVPFLILRDSAENWFVVSPTNGKAKLFLELSVLKDVFGFEWGTPAAKDLLRIPPLASNVRKSAFEVTKAIGVSRSLVPRDTVAKLVRYFRSFSESEEQLPKSQDIYLDLALSQKGVCRHRAFAFLVTAQSLGIPTRMVTNEAHAWVEVHNGTVWKRIDLGGAGRGTLTASGTPHAPPPDPFSWPEGATRGEDLASATSRTSAGKSEQGQSSRAASAATGQELRKPLSSSASGASSELADASESVAPSAEGVASELLRPKAVISLEVARGQLEHGKPFHVEGFVRSEGLGCTQLMVHVFLAEPKSGGLRLEVGAFPTGEQGRFSGGIAVPAGLPVGAYDLTAETRGDARCGPGISSP